MSNRILVIDDDAALAGCLKLRLERSGHQAAIATDGFTGERLARETRPDLILLDVRMPQRDGLATLAALQHAPETREIPVILMSGATDDEGPAPSVRCILKPCTTQQLMDAIERALAQKPACSASSIDGCGGPHVLAARS